MNPNDKEMPEVLATETVFRGKIFSVSVDTVREGDKTNKRDIVHHKGSAAIVPVTPDGMIYLVRQYRHAARAYVLEIPAGSLDAGEKPEMCAARELTEELGLRAGELKKLCAFYVSPGFVSEKMWVYLATDLTETQAAPEDDEDLETVRVSFTHAFEMIAAGEIQDAKTIIGVIHAALHLGFEINPVSL
ncbi:MAG: NUDIX hydrolase [Pyrinomonadaceae bacterium]